MSERVSVKSMTCLLMSHWVYLCECVCVWGGLTCFHFALLISGDQYQIIHTRRKAVSRKVRHSCLQGMMGDSRDCVWEFTQENLHCLCQKSKDVDISLRPSRTEVQNLLPSEDQSGKERRKSVFKKCLYFLLMFLNILFISLFIIRVNICMYIYYTCTIIYTHLLF